MEADEAEAEDDERQLVFEDEDAHTNDEPEEAMEPAEATEAAEDAAPAPRARRVTTPARFALRAFLGVTVGYAVLSVYLYTHPEAAGQLLGRVPLLGAALNETRISPASIQLANVRGEYQRVKGDRLVFVISGTAINNSPLPVKSIQVEGWIGGDHEERRVVFCGAAPRDIGELSLREIALLQTLEPPKDWALAAGEQAEFLIVFPGPPSDLKQFAAQVLTVQAPPRHAGLS